MLTQESIGCKASVRAGCAAEPCSELAYWGTAAEAHPMNEAPMNSISRNSPVNCVDLSGTDAVERLRKTVDKNGTCFSGS